MNNVKRAKVCEFLVPYHRKGWWHLPWLLCSDCFGAERRLRERGILTHDSESGFVADGIYGGQDWIVLTQILGEGFACSLPDVPLRDKSIEATSHMCLGVGKIFLCHWTLDQRGVKDCLCPFSIAAAGLAAAGGSTSFLSFLWSWVSFHQPCSQGRPEPSLSFPTSSGTVGGCILSVVNLPGALT